MGTSPSADNTAANAGREQAIFQIVADVVGRRARGEIVNDDQVFAAHPELMPELKASLARSRTIHRSFLAAQSAGDKTKTQTEKAEHSGSTSTATSAPTAALTSGPPTSQSADPLIAIQGYGIIGQISAGGQGRVFKAVQQSTGQTVAIKLLPGGPLVSRRSRARFDREADILASLNHPNIVSIIDRGRTADGSHFIVMEFIDGWPLDEYIESCRLHEQAPQRIVRLFIDIASAIESAHRLGVIHRDLKPSNIRVDGEGWVHVLDFGLARLESDGDSSSRTVTQTGEIVGSLPWASPEQVSSQHDSLDRRSDVYSLGVMLYQAIARRFPYKVNGPLREVIQGISQAVPPAPSRIENADTRLARPDLDKIVLKALAKSPQDRYASAADLAEDLEKFLAGDRRTQAMRSARKARLRRWAIVLGVAMTCSAGLVAGWRALLPPQVQVQRLERLTNSVGMQFVKIPAGAFVMGSPDGEPGHGEGERRRPVRITRPFFMATTEITQKQYRAVMGNVPRAQAWSGDDLPVQYVMWDEAVEFCKKLSNSPKEQGRTYRLPTEAEWEYACRAGTLGAFGGTGRLEDMGWFKDNSGRKLHPVGEKLPNHWGLFDMHGGVQEWCEDGYQYRPTTTVTDPIERDAKSGRVLRGGSFEMPAEWGRSSARQGTHAESSTADTGFRVVLQIEAN